MGTGASQEELALDEQFKRMLGTREGQEALKLEIQLLKKERSTVHTDIYTKRGNFCNGPVLANILKPKENCLCWASHIVSLIGIDTPFCFKNYSIHRGENNSSPRFLPYQPHHPHQPPLLTP